MDKKVLNTANSTVFAVLVDIITIPNNVRYGAERIIVIIAPHRIPPA
jgi:hypothetical protein